MIVANSISLSTLLEFGKFLTINISVSTAAGSSNSSSKPNAFQVGTLIQIIVVHYFLIFFLLAIVFMYIILEKDTTFDVNYS